MLPKIDLKYFFSRKALFLGAFVFLFNAIDAFAGIALTITADSFSATQITITAGSGTNTVEAGGVNSQGTVSNGRLPSGTSWSGSTGNMNITNLDSVSGFSTSNFVLNGTSTLQYTHNGSTFGSVLNQIETYQSSANEFRVGPTSSMAYPALAEGDTYGFTGSVTFDLNGGMTAAAFTNGSFDNPINGGNFTWTVAIGAVPEPSTYAMMLGSVALLLVGCRRFISQ